MPDLVERLNEALAGRYLIERQLGEGGMATVYLARDEKHARNVALKVLKPELAAVVGGERFLAEIRTTANLQHPHILPLFDSGQAGSFLYYVMPYVEGESLRQRLDRESQLPVDEAVTIAKNVANALAYAHAHGVIHRDIKPANILLQAGEPVISDFGIALAVGVAGGGRLTETGLSLGTPHYMSPEQATGDLNVTSATDTYALGAVLYEMLSGEPPYTGGTAQAVLGKIVTALPTDLRTHRPAVPRNVEAAVRRALEKVPADRFKESDDFAKALADPGFRHGETAAGSGAPGSSGPWRAFAVASTGIAVALGIIAGWLATRASPPGPVARFESPFRESQAPTYFEDWSFNISPDGSALVYVRPGPEGAQQLWLRRWEDPIARPIAGGGVSVYPDISADGQELLSMSFTEVRLLPLDGGPVRAIAPGRWPRWGPDGEIYLQTLDRGIARVSADGSVIEPITEIAEGEDQHIIFDFLPAGMWALVGVDLVSGEHEMRAVDLETGETKDLGPGRAPAYAATGHLLYLEGDVLMAAPLDPRSVERLGAPVAVLEDVLHFVLSDTGDMVYASGRSDITAVDTELVWVTRDGDVTPVEEGWAFDRGGGAFGWSLSPDGRRIALTARVRGNVDIWIKELDGGQLRRLTTEPSDQLQPFWSPDGQTVAYSNGSQGRRTIWARAADGTGEPVELVRGPLLGLTQGQWSSDGEWMVFQAIVGGDSRGLVDIAAWHIGVDSVASVLRAGPNSFENGPALSPDGRWIAYASTETGRYEVFVRPFPDVESGNYQVSSGGGGAAVWSRSGRELFYVNQNGELVAARFDLASGEVSAREPLFRLDQRFVNTVSGSGIDVAPDDDRFLMARPVAGGNQSQDAGPTLVLIQNFQEELRRTVPVP